MKRRNPTLTLALCLSLIAHGLILRFSADRESERLHALLLAGLKVSIPMYEVDEKARDREQMANAQKPDPVPMPDPVLPLTKPEPKLPVPERELFGEKDGKGKAINASEGSQPMIAPTGDQIQAALTHQPGASVAGSAGQTASPQSNQSHPADSGAPSRQNAEKQSAVVKDLVSPMRGDEIASAADTSPLPFGVQTPNIILDPVLPNSKSKKSDKLDIKLDEADPLSEKEQKGNTNSTATPADKIRPPDEKPEQPKKVAIRPDIEKSDKSADQTAFPPIAIINPDAQPMIKATRDEPTTRATQIKDDPKDAMIKDIAEKPVKPPVLIAMAKPPLNLPTTKPEHSATDPTTKPIIPIGSQVAAVTVKQTPAQNPSPANERNTPAATPSSASVASPAIPSSSGELGTKSPSESDPFLTAESFIFRDGAVTAKSGRKVKTTKPRLTDAGIQALLSLNDPSVLVGVKVNPEGKVDSVKILRSSGSNEVDLPVYRAVYDWEVEPTLDASGKPIPDAFVILFSFR